MSNEQEPSIVELLDRLKNVGKPPFKPLSKEELEETFKQAYPSAFSGDPMPGKENTPGDPHRCSVCDFWHLTDEVKQALASKGIQEGGWDYDFAECRCDQAVRAARSATERLRHEHLEASNLPKGDDVEPKVFDGFENLKGAEEALAAARLFCSGSAPETVLMLSGDTGSGKSHLAEGACRWSIDQGVSARYEYVPDMLTRIQATYDRDSALQTTAVLEPINSAQILALDDLGLRAASEWVMEQITTILEMRIHFKRRLFITTNMETMDECEALLGLRAASRLWDDATGNVRRVFMTCGDYRSKG